MGMVDKAKNAGQDAAGKVKEAAGKATGKDSLEAEGRAEQSEADLKKSVESAKDAFKD
jgi:uncharacterized protein YjbJ (UPF0337 family)